MRIDGTDLPNGCAEAMDAAFVLCEASAPVNEEMMAAYREKYPDDSGVTAIGFQYARIKYLQGKSDAT